MVAAPKNRKKPKLTPQQILENIIDKDALQARKDNRKVEEDKKEVVNVVEEKKEDVFKWWEHPMDKNLFKKKKINNEYFGHYEHWKEESWIGPYKTSKELADVIKSYVEETKKPIGQRKIENIHSVVIKNIKENE